MTETVSALCVSCDIFFFCGFLTIFIINFFIHSKLTGFDSVYTVNLAKNWITSPIIDIQLGNQCSGNYSQLILDTWPGTVRGCICSGVIQIGSCTSDDDENTNYCTDINEIIATPLSIWHGSGFCVKRTPVTSYLDFTISSSDSDCPSYLKNCGKLDSMGNYLCVSATIECPINYIKILAENEIVPNGFKYLKLSRNGIDKKLIFGNNGSTGMIITELKISDNTPCVNPYFYSKSSNSYILDYIYNRDRCFFGYGGKLYDDNYIPIDTMKLDDLYLDNNILYSIKSQLPNYPVNILQSETRLFYRNYIGLNKKCYEEIKYDKVFRNIVEGLYFIQENYINYTNVYTVIYVFIIISWTFCFIIYFLSRTFMACIGEQNIAKIVLEILTFLFLLVISILYIVFYTHMGNIKSNYKDFLPYIACGDPSYSDAVPKFINNIDKVYQLALANMIISLIILLIPVHIYFVPFVVVCLDFCLKCIFLRKRINNHNQSTNNELKVHNINNNNNNFNKEIQMKSVSERNENVLIFLNLDDFRK